MTNAIHTSRITDQYQPLSSKHRCTRKQWVYRHHPSLGVANDHPA